ncbi:xanthine dehydrogenase family protein molybdopterin-binding subunit [Acidithiobacillus sp. M4-SHS-6]|uniref:xanthine dehydrogenase family protein molybdopterin-binding subunit n=1 Tax=Acidithiobacillus sp. M4-SHS-6 TaxID=3383024 RepID=UPI0039BEC6CC
MASFPGSPCAVDNTAQPKRVDGLSKIFGTAVYVDDIVLSDVIYAATLRTACAGGIVEEVVFDPALDWSEFIIVTAKDIPGVNAVKLLENDQPVLVDRVFRHAGEALALLAHPEPDMLKKALSHIRVHEVPLAHPIFDIDEALCAETQITPDNIYTDYLLEKGDVDKAFEEVECFIDGCFVTPSQEQLYIEPQGMIAILQDDGVLRIDGSMQCPYYVLDALEQCTGLNKDQLRVVQTTTGGAFGGKEDYPSIIACHAALLALKSGGLPVKLIYERGEDMRVTPKRHPSRTVLRLGANRAGELQFIDMDFAIDGGAYRTLSPVVLSRGVIHAAGPYRCDNIRIRGRAVATNHPPFGAFRGFGAPQSIFALEVGMDRLAAKLDMDPAELRRKNLLRSGDISPTGDLLQEDCFAQDILEEALQVSQYYERQREFRSWNTENHSTVRGIGLATFAHGAGFTGNGELYLASRVLLQAHANGQVEILCSNTEMGQGAATTLVQIAAEALQLPMRMVRLAQTDTTRVPNSGPTVASRTCMVVGELIEKAAKLLLQKLMHEGGLAEIYTSEEFAEACLRMLESKKDLLVTASYQPPSNMLWDEKKFAGRAYASYAWAAYIAEVEIDKLTCETRILNFTAAQEIGHAVHPQIVQGQIEGGVVQGIGYALYENVLWNDVGVMANDRLANYIIPTTADIRPLQVVLMEKGLGAGPKGAKGVGELPMDGPAPAIVNAIQQAMKVKIDQIPAMPEMLMKLTCTERDSQ